MVFAVDRAVKISIGSNGAGNVGPTIASVRQIVGHALGSGVVDKFVVTSPVEGNGVRNNSSVPSRHQRRRSARRKNQNLGIKNLLKSSEF